MYTFKRALRVSDRVAKLQDPRGYWLVCRKNRRLFFSRDDNISVSNLTHKFSLEEKTVRFSVHNDHNNNASAVERARVVMNPSDSSSTTVHFSDISFAVYSEGFGFLSIIFVERP